MSALSAAGQVLYAMRVSGNLIKIGTTSDLAERRRKLGGEMLAVSFGGLADEQAIHERLAPHVHHGREWYRPTPEVIAVVNEMRAEMGMSAVAS